MSRMDFLSRRTTLLYSPIYQLVINNSGLLASLLLNLLKNRTNGALVAVSLETEPTSRDYMYKPAMAFIKQAYPHLEDIFKAL